MTLLHRLASVLDWLLHRTQAEQRLDDELQAFVEMSAAEKMRDGLSPRKPAAWPSSSSAASSRSRSAFAPIATAAGSTRSGGTCATPCRMFVAHSRLHRSSSSLTLALGIGANTAIFSLIDALMLRWLPVRNPQELVQVMLEPPDASGSPG